MLMLPIRPNSSFEIPNFSDEFQAINTYGESGGGGYDAAALIVLAMAQGGVNADSTPLEIRAIIAANLALVSGTGASEDAMQIKPGELAIGLEHIASGGTVDYDGATGVINFDGFGDVSYGLYRLERLTLNDEGGPDSECILEGRLFPTETGVDTEERACPDPE